MTADRASTSGPRRLHSILERWEPVQEGVDPDAASAVAAVWSDAVGVDVARRTRPGRLRDGTLTVYTTASTWSHQLTFLAPTILAALGERCPEAGVTRLRFVVASGRTKALLDGIARTALALERARGDGTARSPALTIDDRADDVEDIVARLRRRQQALDRARERAGWRRCERCATWREPSGAASAPCARCREEARRASDRRIETMLADAPWMRRAEMVPEIARSAARAAVAGGVEDADGGDSAADAYDRVRRRLLSRWEEQLFAAQRRLRRGALLPTDRMIAWSYVMLRSGMQQRSIGRAVVADALGDAWADALAQPPNAQAQEATATAFQKHRKTTPHAFKRRGTTTRESVEDDGR